MPQLTDTSPKTIYSTTPPNGKSPHTLSHFLQTKIGVYQAYAALAGELLNRFGIANKLITGTVEIAPGNKQGHAWLGIELDGQWYHFDPTWNDLNNTDIYRDTYLAMTTSELMNDIERREIYIQLPEASVRANETIPYSAQHFNAAMQAFTEQKWQHYLNNYWVTFNTSFEPIVGTAMHIDESRSYTLIIDANGDVMMDIDGLRVIVNSLPADIAQRIKLPANGYMQGTTRYIPVTAETFQLQLAPLTPFLDIEASYAKPMIEALYTRSIIKGVSATSFAPKATLTRGHVIGMIGRYLGYEDGPSAVGRHWASEHFNKMQQLAIISTEANMNGYAPMTRAEAAQLICALLKQQGVAPAQGAHFSDRADFESIAAYEAAITLRGLGILDGNQLNLFNPSAPLTREQFAKIFFNTIQYLH